MGADIQRRAPRREPDDEQATGAMGLLEHLEELRKRMIRGCVAGGCGVLDSPCGADVRGWKCATSGGDCRNISRGRLCSRYGITTDPVACCPDVVVAVTEIVWTWPVGN